MSYLFIRFRSIFVRFLYVPASSDNGVDYFIVTDPSEITVHPVAGPKTEGDDVILSCDVVGNPAPTILWTRDGSPVDSSDSSRITFSADKKQFTIRDVNRTDNGEYRCVANNILGNATSNGAILDVQCKNGVVLLKLVTEIYTLPASKLLYACCRIELELKIGLSS